jgi:hypothetical protein
MNCDKVFCKNCTRFYIATGEDQCEIPSSGMNLLISGTEEENNFSIAKGEIDLEKIEFIKSHLTFIHYSNEKHTMIYGKPSKLNKNNNCPFYKKPYTIRDFFRNIWD